MNQGCFDFVPHYLPTDSHMPPSPDNRASPFPPFGIWASPFTKKLAPEAAYCSPHPMDSGNIPYSWLDAPFNTQDDREGNTFSNQDFISYNTGFGNNYSYVANPDPSATLPTPMNSSVLPEHKPSPYLEPCPPTATQYDGVVGHAPQGLGIHHSGANIAQRPLPEVLVNPHQNEPQREATTVPPTQSSTRIRERLLAPRPGRTPPREENATSRSARTRNSLEKKRKTRRKRKIPLDEEIEEYVEYLRFKEELDWNSTRQRVNTRFGTNFKTPCLQMRVTRRKQQRLEWSEDDVRNLKKAQAQAGTDFEIIERLMDEQGNPGEWGPSESRSKWHEFLGFPGPPAITQPHQQNINIRNTQRQMTRARQTQTRASRRHGGKR